MGFFPSIRSTSSNKAHQKTANFVAASLLIKSYSVTTVQIPKSFRQSKSYSKSYMSQAVSRFLFNLCQGIHCHQWPKMLETPFRYVWSFIHRHLASVNEAVLPECNIQQSSRTHTLLSHHGGWKTWLLAEDRWLGLRWGVPHFADRWKLPRIYQDRCHMIFGKSNFRLGF